MTDRQADKAVPLLTAEQAREINQKLAEMFRHVSDTFRNMTMGLQASGIFGQAWREDMAALTAALGTIDAEELAKIRATVNRLAHAVRREQARRVESPRTESEQDS